MMARSRATIAALALCAVYAADARSQARAPFTLQRLTNLDAKRIAEIGRGEAVAITIESPDKTEIAMIGVVRIDVPRTFYVDRVRDLTSLLTTGMRLNAGTFSDPARPEDVAALALEPSDAKALEKCKLYSCDVKLPAALMDTLRSALARSHDPAPRADAVMREWVLSYVNAYRADSTEPLVVYDDTRRSVRSSDAFHELVTEPMPAGIDSQPFAQMLALPRGARPPEISSRITWELDRFSGLKPTLEVVERFIYAPAYAPGETFMATKLLYASHYFESQIDCITLADAEPVDGKPASYLVILRRQKFDDLPSGGLFNIRGKAIKRLRDGLRTTLASTRAEAMQAYAASTAGHAP